MEKKWYQSKIFWTMIVSIIGTVGGIVSGDVQAPVAIPALAMEVLTVVFRLFFSNTNLVK